MINPLRNSIVLIVVLVLLASCGGAARPTTPPQATITQIPTYAYVPPTEAPVIQTAVIATSTVAAGGNTPDPQRIEAGKGRYEALQCGSCHGDKGQGTDKGSALAGTKLTQEQFIDWLRTGGKLGNAHLYSTNRLSETGGQNLYLYVLSLK